MRNRERRPVIGWVAGPASPGSSIVIDVTQADDRIPRIRKTDLCPCDAPILWRTWTALWSAMGSPELETKRDRWQTSANWAERAGVNVSTADRQLYAANRQHLVRKRNDSAGNAVFARVDRVATRWSEHEIEAFDHAGWRWWSACD